MAAAASGGIVMPHNRGWQSGIAHVGEGDEFVPKNYSTIAPLPNQWGGGNVMVSGNTAQATYTNASALLAK